MWSPPAWNCRRESSSISAASGSRCGTTATPSWGRGRRAMAATPSASCGRSTRRLGGHQAAWPATCWMARRVCCPSWRTLWRSRAIGTRRRVRKMVKSNPVPKPPKGYTLPTDPDPELTKAQGGLNGPCPGCGAELQRSPSASRRPGRPRAASSRSADRAADSTGSASRLPVGREGRCGGGAVPEVRRAAPFLCGQEGGSEQGPHLLQMHRRDLRQFRVGAEGRGRVLAPPFPRFGGEGAGG